MSKKIKKQIKRSLPYFMIFSLIISSTVVGLVFNFDFQIEDLSLNRPEAIAQSDSATTTVTVKNAPPQFVILPAEEFDGGQGSTSTSPVNVGAAISFSVTATDVENNDYYLAICSTDSITASSTGGAPTCGGTEFCISNGTADGSEATCTYSNVANFAPETIDWYAFVCDNHATQGDCSVSSQGSDEGTNATSSPMYLNHAPSLDAATTSVDFVVPGDTFTFTATSTDNDITGGADLIQMDICATNSWSTSTFETSGCDNGQAICTGTSTAVGGEAVISCDATTTIPTVDQSYNYWVFVQDWHTLAGTGNAQQEQYTVINQAPQVGTVYINGDSSVDVVLFMKDQSEVVASTTAQFTDDNGCDDVTTASSSIYWENAVGGQYCSTDDNNCYLITDASCVITGCSGPSDLDAFVTCTTTLAYHTLPTDGDGNTASTTDWRAGMNVYDEALSGNATTTAGNSIEILTLAALHVTEAQIDYGTIKGGFDSGNYNATTTVINYGNSPLDTNMQGDDMDDLGANWFAASEQRFDVATNTYASLANQLASSSPVFLDVDMIRPTSQTDFDDNVYWGINIPGGTPSGDYYGMNYFNVVLDDDAW